MSTYPEHALMASVLNESQAIGEFIEWLQENGYHIAEWERHIECANKGWKLRLGGDGPEWRCVDGNIMYWNIECESYTEASDTECDECVGTGLVERNEPRLYPTALDTTRLLARYFNIDLLKIEAEKRQMLDEIQKGNCED